jgi:pyruvate/2-oxoglutarate dehydrogenase complex dihydrolipoamide acyltransferase (E2) component
VTAPGHVMRCDKAGCNAAATVDQDAWSFCADHAGTPRTAWKQDRRPVVSLDQPRLTQPAATAPQSDPGPIGLLLEQATGHSVAKVRRLAEKIETQLDDLRRLVAEHAADEQRRQAEAAAKAAARVEVQRLEQQLAAAKAKLRGKPATAAPRPAPTDSGSYDCRKGCGRTFDRPQGRGKHELSCTAGAA